MSIRIKLTEPGNPSVCHIGYLPPNSNILIGQSYTIDIGDNSDFCIYKVARVAWMVGGKTLMIQDASNRKFRIDLMSGVWRRYRE
jgi:hypothetical protein